MGGRVNTIMQTCFFAISGVLPREQAIAAIKSAIKKTYGKKGEDIVQKNFQAVDQTIANLHEVKVPAKATSTIEMPPPVSPKAPKSVREFMGAIIKTDGDTLPVSLMPVDGTFPTGTAKWEKRCIALEIPVWDPGVCIQCAKCSMACPHAAIRFNIYPEASLKGAPATFKSTAARGKEYEGMKCTVQVAPEDCTGCGLCVQTCPAKNKTDPSKKAINMAPLDPLRAPERDNFEFFLSLPDFDRRKVKVDTVKGSQLLRPLFEFSGACAGCGETPYVGLLAQLFGDRAIIGNATGCSSIYGGNLPTTPYTTDANGRGPTWCNSLFEDNAEFGFGYRLTLDKHGEFARELVVKMKDVIGADLAEAIVTAKQYDETQIHDQRERVAQLKKRIAAVNTPDAKQLRQLADCLVKKSVWILGGDGWAYDIGYGGLDHVLASGRNVNVLVLDTEVYSNTGGQMSKSTPRAAVAKFAAGGKPMPKKDLGMIAMMYGNVYVAKVAMGANDMQTVKAFVEAERYEGPSLIIAYSHCIAHGINMQRGFEEQKNAVSCGHWPLYRFNPDLAAEGKNPLQIDSKTPTMKFAEYAYNETRYKMLTKSKPEEAKRLIELAQQDADYRLHVLQQFASFSPGNGNGENAPAAEAKAPAAGETKAPAAAAH
jgi:pyruvate-ferredoxin/flavodoxin oxidoreductase